MLPVPTIVLLPPLCSGAREQTTYQQVHQAGGLIGLRNPFLSEMSMSLMTSIISTGHGEHDRVRCVRAESVDGLERPQLHGAGLSPIVRAAAARLIAACLRRPSPLVLVRWSSSGLLLTGSSHCPSPDLLQYRSPSDWSPRSRRIAPAISGATETTCRCGQDGSFNATESVTNTSRMASWLSLARASPTKSPWVAATTISGRAPAATQGLDGAGDRPIRSRSCRR